MSEAKLSRKINLLQASAINMIDMVGIGPFVVMSFVVEKLHGGYICVDRRIITQFVAQANGLFTT